MPEYPIAVADFDDKHPADLAICERCGHQERWDPGEGDPYDLCATHDGCGGQIHFKYWPAGACSNCGKIGGVGVDGHCSRRCQLQAEHARQLAARE